MKLNPLQTAILENNLDLVSELKDLKWRFENDKNGFSPLELSEFLGNEEIQKLFITRKPKTIRLQLKDQNSPSLITVQEFEKIFHLKYRRFLFFPSYETLIKTVNNCPYFFRFQWLLGKNDEQESFYQDLLLNGLTAKSYIKWVDPVKEYGLFASLDLEEKTFIGEYTGVIKQVDKKNPDLNPFCFHYPSKFFSYNYFAIDAKNEGNTLRFINHSDQPNLQPLWLVQKNVAHLVFIANQFIAKDTELTFNYGKDFWINRQPKP